MCKQGTGKSGDLYMNKEMESGCSCVSGCGREERKEKRCGCACLKLEAVMCEGVCGLFVCVLFKQLADFRLGELIHSIFPILPVPYRCRYEGGVSKRRKFRFIPKLSKERGNNNLLSSSVHLYEITILFTCNLIEYRSTNQ